ncbi:FAM72 domain-containing protein [Tubulinosema ratisbonensis]|uniref:FAM72 domain-containing protein n=1 Tax=Tubulinosema ratisbonensis TaxID=291195 RepID=A0A437AKU7_9MICR|nr:FAM72 domain-containing protein [Tubulinosema ratisbonensis]
MPVKDALFNNSEEKIYSLVCKECRNPLVKYSLKSCLLTDYSVNFYSTNVISEKISTVNGFYKAFTCKCRVTDMGCINCGTIIGYHIMQPCIKCLSSKNNGHLWMFYEKLVYAFDNTKEFKKSEKLDNKCKNELEIER